MLTGSAMVTLRLSSAPDSLPEFSCVPPLATLAVPAPPRNCACAPDARAEMSQVASNPFAEICGLRGEYWPSKFGDGQVDFNSTWLLSASGTKANCSVP